MLRRLVRPEILKRGSLQPTAADLRVSAAEDLAERLLFLFTADPTGKV